MKVSKNAFSKLFLVCFFTFKFLSLPVSASDKQKCLAEFEEICPLERFPNDKVAQLKCIVDLHYENRAQLISKKCRLMAVGLYQNLKIPKIELETIFNKFNKPKECESMNKSDWWYFRDEENIMKSIHGIDFTIVTQCSVDRLWMLGEFCKRWGGDIIVTVTGVKQGYIPRIPGCSEFQPHFQQKANRTPSLTRQSSIRSHNKNTNSFRQFANKTIQKRKIGIDEENRNSQNNSRRRRRLVTSMRDYKKAKKQAEKKSGQIDLETIDKFQQKINFSPRSEMVKSILSSRPLLDPREKVKVFHSFEEKKDSNYGKQKRKVLILTYEVDTSELFPVNQLRNFGLCRVETSHLFYTDIDLWPSSGLYSELHRVKMVAPKRFSNPMHATVIPAFQMLRGPRSCTKGEKSRKISRSPCFRDASPPNKAVLIQCLTEPHDEDEVRRCQPFDEIGNPEGHASTDYKTWYSQTQLRSLDCFRSDRYEPYLVLPVSPLTPLFEEEFRGYGKNKIQHVMHLQAKGFIFSVLPNEFVVHFPHAASEARMVWDVKGSRGSQRQMNNDVYSSYLAWLNQTYRSSLSYNEESTSMVKTPVCEGVTEYLTWTERAKLRKAAKQKKLEASLNETNFGNETTKSI